jgi:hypothetical protein
MSSGQGYTFKILRTRLRARGCDCVASLGRASPFVRGLWFSCGTGTGSCLCGAFRFKRVANPYRAGIFRWRPRTSAE